MSFSKVEVKRSLKCEGFHVKKVDAKRYRVEYQNKEVITATFDSIVDFATDSKAIAHAKQFVTTMKVGGMAQ